MRLSAIVDEDIDYVATRDLPWEKLRDRTIAITGANGMVGTYLTLALLRANMAHGLNLRVVGLVRNLAKAHDSFHDFSGDSSLTLIEQDVSERFTDLPNADYFVHAASQASPGYFASDPVGTIRANTVGTFNCLDYAVRSGVSHFLLISTREIYGEPPPDQKRNFVESDLGIVDTLDPRSSYSEGKRASETIAMSYASQFGLNVRIARLAHSFGPGMPSDDGRVQASFLANVIARNNIVLKSRGSLVRSYTYIADVTYGLLLLLLADDNVVCNLADDLAVTSIKELAEVFCDAEGTKESQLVFELDDQDTAGWSPISAGMVDASKLRSLGWQARFSLAENVLRWIQHERSQSRSNVA
jgi:UDP-glucuronate decarboxylase